MKRKCCALLTACALLCLSLLSCTQDEASETTVATTTAATVFTIDTESDTIPTVCYLEFEDPELYSLIQTYIESATADAVWEVFEASWAEHTATSQPQ